MQKILSRIFSVALATALVAPTALATGQKPGGKVKAETSHKISPLTDFKSRTQKTLPAAGLSLKSRTDEMQLFPGLRQTTKHFAKSVSKKAPVKVKKAADRMPELIGSLLYSRNNEHARGGIYKIPTSEDADFELVIKANAATNGGVLIDNTYFATNYQDQYGPAYADVRGWDLSTGRNEFWATLKNTEAVLVGESVDPTTGTIYGIGYNAAGDGLQISTIEFEGEDQVNITAVAPFNYNVATMAIDGNGQMYVITFETEVEEEYDYEYVSASYLYRVDKTTGEATFVGETGQTPEYQTGAAIDPKSGRMFWTVSTEWESFLLYKSMEFVGEGIKSLSMDDRFTIANMAIEAGGKNGIFPVDELAEAYIKEHSHKPYTIYEADEDAVYEEEYTIDLSTLRPTIAFPHLPENTKTIDEIKEDISIDQVVIGSCTNGRIDDLRTAAKILKGRTVAKGMRCIIIPATQAIYMQAMEEGLLKIFIEAGAVVSTPTCGPCLGGYMGILAEGERCVSTTNRNFVGRMGHVNSEIYLASPAVAAASAVTGRISSPEQL